MTFRKRWSGSKSYSYRSHTKLTLHKLDWLEWVTIGLAAWFLFFPHPYRLLLGVLLVIPILGLLLNGLHKPSMASLVEVDLRNDKYDVADFIDVAAWVILLRVLIDFEFEDFYSLLLPGTIAFALILLILFLTHDLIEKRAKKRNWIYASIIFNICLYSYAGTYALNCGFDNSKPVVYKTEILDKYINRGRKGRRSYYIRVAPWGHHHDEESIRVPSSWYDDYEIGDYVKIDLREGLLHIPWYHVEKEALPGERHTNF